MNAAQLRLEKSRSHGKTVGFSAFATFALSVVFLGLSFLLIANSVKSISTAYQRNLLLEQAENEVQELRMKNLALLGEKDYVTSAAYVEEEARNRLLYTKGGEVLLVLPETGESLSEEQVMGDENQKHVESEYDSWLVWWDFLLNGV